MLGHGRAQQLVVAPIQQYQILADLEQEQVAEVVLDGGMRSEHGVILLLMGQVVRFPF